MPDNNTTCDVVEPLGRQEVRTLQEKGRKAVEKKLSTLVTLVVEYVSPDSIYPNDYNPNRQTERDFELLLSSMTEDGFTQPILVQRKTNIIVDGEHRWRAAHRLGLTEIPVVFTDMSPSQARVSTLRHNRARGSEDIELTIEVLKDLRDLGALDHAIDSLGMSDKEINALIEDLPAPEKQAAEEHSNAWMVTVPDSSEHKLGFAQSNKDMSMSRAAKVVADNTQATLNTMNDEEDRQRIMQAIESRLVRVDFKMNVEYQPLVIGMLGETYQAQRLLNLCNYHLSVSK